MRKVIKTSTLTKRQEAELEVAELKKLSFSLGMMSMCQDWMSWLGYIKRCNSECIGRRMVEMDLPGRRKRGRPKRSFLDEAKEEMRLVGVTEKKTVKVKLTIGCGDP